MKKFLSMMLVIVMALSLIACGASEPAAPEAPAEPEAPVATEAPAPAPTEAPAEPVTIRIGGQQGPTSMGMVKMLKDSENGLTTNKYEYVLDNADALNTALMKGELDVVGISANAISILNAKSQGQVLFCAVNALGCNYFLENGNTVTDLQSLKGKTIYSVGKGLTPEYCMAHIFKLHGMDLYKDVEIIWKSDANEIVSILASTPGAIGMLPQPVATVVQMQAPDVRVAIDLVEAWEEKDTESKFIL
ncbi:MAG: ABC transporter substrate-binding protein, partial [Oscillospiraceae bacterium]|nr:ABC transporter substrate-binding protein [Oscillospiraceae bacterium]